MIGATAYEFQWGRVCLRILRPKMYFWPRRHFAMRDWWVVPKIISVTLAPREEP